jgi:hypothetical protein
MRDQITCQAFIVGTNPSKKAGIAMRSSNPAESILKPPNISRSSLELRVAAQTYAVTTSTCLAGGRMRESLGR